MDIFEIAKQGMDIQLTEIKEKQEEEKLQAQAKSYKVDIFDAINAAANKDYDWYNRLGENQKAFQPFMLNMWLSMVWNKNSTQRKFNNNDKVYAEILKDINYTLNRQLYSVPKEMFWLLACSINEYDAPFVVDYKKSLKKTSGDKYDKKVINYIANELYSSTEKVMDMIDSGLITLDDMEAIALDLETLDDQKKKK